MTDAPSAAALHAAIREWESSPHAWPGRRKAMTLMQRMPRLHAEFISQLGADVTAATFDAEFIVRLISFQEEHRQAGRLDGEWHEGGESDESDDTRASLRGTT